ncbi:MAG: YcjF family protein [Pirellulaceae bacterium]
MRAFKSFSGLLLLLVTAALGIALIWLPGMIINQYETASSLGGIWGTFYLVLVGTGFVLVIGSIGWTLWRLWGRSVSKKLRRERQNKNPSQLSYDQMTREVDNNLQSIESLGEGAGDSPAIQQELQPLVGQVENKREQQTLEIVAFGTISSGKSSVLNLLAGREVFATHVRGGTTVNRNEIPWPGMDKVILVDTPGLGEIDGASHVNISADCAKDADLVLLVVDGPLRASEHELLQQLGCMEKRVVICLNKTDWFTDEDRDKLLGQLRIQTVNEVHERDVVAIQAETGFRTRRQVLTDGTTVDEKIEVAPDIEPLALRLTKVIEHDGKRLIMANLLLQSRGLVEKARDKVKDSLDQRAWKVVDRYMWGAGGAAAVVPFPLVDLAVGVGISTKMIVDLAEIYQQKVDLETASRWLSEMGKNLIGVLGANAAAPAVAALVGSLLKTIPVAGQLAGGMLQGAVQALITKWIGAVFIEYFRNEMQTPLGGLSGLARRQWEEVTTVNELRKLLVTARQKLTDSGE